MTHTWVSALQLPSLEEEWIAYEGRSIIPGGVEVAVNPVAINEEVHLQQSGLYLS